MGNNIKYTLFFTAIILVITVGSCKYDSNEELFPDINNDYNCDTVFPFYRKDIVPIITAYCTSSAYGSCHQVNSPHSQMNNYTNLKFLVDGGHVLEHVIKAREMPPPYSLGPKTLPLSLIRKIDCWVNHGALDN